MAIDVLDPSLELRVRLVSKIAGQKRREWACHLVNGCRKLLSLGHYPVRRCGGWRDGCVVVVVAMGRLMCPLVYAKGQIVRKGCGAGRALKAGGGRNGTAAIAIIVSLLLLLLLVLIPILILILFLRLPLPVATPLALGVGPPVREPGSELGFEPRVTKEEDESESGGPEKIKLWGV
jgi:hypothetical protein